MILLFTLNAWEQKLKKQIYAENEKSQSAQEQNKIVSRSLWQTVIQFVRSCTWGLFSAFITIVHQLYSVTCLPKLTQTNTTGFNSTSSKIVYADLRTHPVRGELTVLNKWHLDKSWTAIVQSLTHFFFIIW